MELCQKYVNVSNRKFTIILLSLKHILNLENSDSLSDLNSFSISGCKQHGIRTPEKHERRKFGADWQA